MKANLFPLLLMLSLAGHAAAQTEGKPATTPDEAGAPENAPKIVSKPFLVPDGTDEDRLKDAARTAAEEVWKEFIQAAPNGVSVSRFAILPLQKDIDGEYLALQLRNQFTEICGPQGLELYTRMDQEWQTLLKEIEWGESFGDTMDAATIQKFGRVKGVEALVFPRILGIAKTDSEGVKLRLNVQVFEIETGRQLWGREVIAEQAGTLVPVSQAPLVQEV
ncbi:MAG: hypothetical protein KDL87_13660, partial [Verrucomicrobiae bacterium]|nr:hypothetical protein [Verrucomicrobiae bacterium]